MSILMRESLPENGVYAGTLVKLDDVADALHPNNRPMGETTEGHFAFTPREGLAFFIASENTFKDGIRTSKVQEIVSESQTEIRFKTLNSLYVLTITGARSL